MQKTLDFLERNVQWLTLGLAGLVLLWVAYAFVLSPVTVKVGNKELTPGEVDAAVKRDAADRLKNAMDDKTRVSFQVGDWEAQVKGIFEHHLPGSAAPNIAIAKAGNSGTSSTRPTV